MALRVYICPAIGSGTKLDPYRSKAFALMPAVTTTRIANWWPSVLNGVPTSWAITVIAATDFTAIDADATCDDIFQGDLPGSIVDRASFVGFISGRTVGDVPAARRNRITAVMDKYGVNHADFSLATPLAKALRRFASTLFAQDDNFGLTVDSWGWD